MRTTSPMPSTVEALLERVERLLLRHEELRRTNDLLSQQLASVSTERDNLRSRLAAARARIDALIDKLPDGGADEAAARAAEPRS